MLLAECIATLEDWFPPALAESWDNVGLLLGDRHGVVERIMTCLTVTEQTATEAVREQADLVISHHPIFFRPIQRFTVDGADSAVYLLARHGIAVYSPHTALDNAMRGINQQLAERLGLTDIGPLRARGIHHRADQSFDKYKLVVFVPTEDLAAVQLAMFNAGAGNIGEYSECSFRVQGIGTFLGSENSHPTIGQAGQREDAPEWRLEVMMPAAKVQAVVAAMVQAHSYEEPAYDLYPLGDVRAGFGMGRCGRLPVPMALRDVATHTKRLLGSKHAAYVGDPNMMVQTVGVACGAGADFLADARRARCDVLVTGEARFHQALSAESMDLGLIIAGHYASERFALDDLAHHLGEQWPTLRVWASHDELDPLHPIDSNDD